MGQMDCPICAIAPLTGPLLPIPALLRTGAIASPTESACAAGIDARAAAQTPAVTMTGRRTDVTTSSAVSHVDRAVSSLVRSLDIGRRKKPALFVAVMLSSPPSALHAHRAQISL